MKDIIIFKVDISPNIKEEIISQRLKNYRYRENRGWQSKGFASQPFSWLDYTFDQVSNVIGKDLQIDRWWMNVNFPGEYTNWHQHRAWKKVAVLYINTSPDSGNIEFRKKEEYFEITPKMGDLIVFPGDLEHRVHTNKSPDYRVSIAFNFQQKKEKN